MTKLEYIKKTQRSFRVWSDKGHP